VTCPQAAAQASIIKPEMNGRNSFMNGKTLLLRGLWEFYSFPTLERADNQFMPWNLILPDSALFFFADDWCLAVPKPPFL
jgi:hypothetical protein